MECTIEKAIVVQTIAFIHFYGSWYYLLLPFNDE
ncbi:hypothetical protein HNR53_001832 [Bacillus benzoevorans]|uniref:Uncharacterized protein n=1 Tax=Bacillus benzoevorans TaxID=1456 RepID=A0A7X0LWC9_9BACI|nr:hypothetical protein [Bacillus benzoevorans]